MANISGNARITDQIMDYYVRHGQNRDLERFLRLRAASTTRSSSDGSLPGLEELDRRERVAEKVGRSMENLSTMRGEEQGKEKGKSRERLDASGGSGKSSGVKSPAKVEAAPEVVVKEVKSEKKSGRNFNFNLESVIEIKLPQAPPVQPAMLVSPRQAILGSAPGPAIHEISSAGTQTMPEARSVEQQTEEPIRPVLKPSNLNPAEDTIETTRDISPSSSVASAKQKLEWDSLGDIGYDSNEKFYFCGASDLNETEKRCLQKYFAKKGLNFDEKIVVVKNVPSKKVEVEEPKETPKVDAPRKWQNVYQKYKEKYPNPSEISLSLMNPDAQSTPKVVGSKEVPPRTVKSTQTSLVKILTKGIQAAQSIDTTSKQVGTSPQKSLSSNSNKTPSVVEPTTDQADVADSFEFFSSPPSINESNQVHQSSTGSTLKTSPEVTSSTSSSSAMQQSTGGEYNFDDELRLGMTLYNTIYESPSLPARVKQSLIDKIFRKMVKNDPRGRTKEQLLEYCGKVKRDEKKVVEGMSGVEEVASSGSSRTSERGGKERADTPVVAVEEVVEEEKSRASTEGEKDGKSQEISDPIVKNFQELSVKSNEGRNPATSLTSSQPTLSSSRPDSSKGTAKHRSQFSLPKSSLSDGVRSSDQRIRRAMTDYLRPMTRSEVDYANQQDLRRSRETVSAPTTTTSSGDRIFALFQKEKQTQLLKVDKKIEHLKAIKLLLLEEQQAVREIRGGTGTTVPVQEKFRKPLAPPTSEEKENIYENTQRRVRSSASAPVYTSVHGDTPSADSKNETEYSTESESAWNSHYHLKKMIQNRSKLETPTSDESIATFIKARKDKFIENYERHRKRSMLDDQQHLYTKPYSGRQSKQDHYSRLDEKYSVRKLAKSPSIDVFISSDSMSIPAANTLTNTTTHQYDIKSTRSSPESLTTNAKPAGTQTTSSILRTKPIFESQPKTSTAVQVPSAAGCHCACDCPCRHRQQQPQPTKHTEIVDGTHRKQDKQQQTKPSSIAYVITFQGGDTKRQLRDPEKDQVYRTSSTDTSSKTNDDPDQLELLPLKEQFRRARPSTLSRLKERQKCVNELHKLRSERNKQRKKLLLLTSDDSLRRCDVKQRLPPPPLAQTRIFSSKAIRENTRRQVKNLPEVLRKKEIEKINNLKRKNLILRDKFNKNLQRKVLHGHVDLSNSVRVMQD
ncbi:centrosome-associated protein Alms1a-like [Culex pipiens pallens]|uniref:centrosome-associated protein Alms1a-like n=1 Tax=Culex pipiens pallens TaxID=42434 RepID=UPI001952A7E0|nr:centrosome-associated protein Alms1a-like [Culex pipiens pallens]